MQQTQYNPSNESIKNLANCSRIPILQYWKTKQIQSWGGGGVIHMLQPLRQVIAQGKPSHPSCPPNRSKLLNPCTQMSMTNLKAFLGSRLNVTVNPSQSKLLGPDTVQQFPPHYNFYYLSVTKRIVSCSGDGKCQRLEKKFRAKENIPKSTWNLFLIMKQKPKALNRNLMIHVE